MQEYQSSTDANFRALAMLRIGVGVFFLIFGEYKVFGTQFTLHGGFQYWINRFLERRLSFHGARASRLRALTRHTHCVSRGLWRTRHWHRLGWRYPGATCQRVWICFYADTALFFGLPRRKRAVLAILWRQLKPLRVHALFRRLLARPRRLRLVR